MVCKKICADRRNNTATRAEAVSLLKKHCSDIFLLDDAA